VGWIIGWSHRIFYRAVGRRKAGGQGEEGSGGGTSMSLVTGDGNDEGEAMWCDRFQRGRGEETRQLHGARGRRHNEEQCGGQGGRRRQLAFGGRR
jgi:hypothetical protein